MSSKGMAGQQLAIGRRGDEQAADHAHTALDERSAVLLFSAHAVVRGLAVAALLLVILGIVGQWSLGRPDYPGRDLLAGLTDPGGESNLTAAFSASLLVCVAALFAVIARFKRADAYARVWRGLAWVFVYLAVDELAMLHERTVVFVREALGEAATSGILHHAWVVPYALFCVIVFSATVRFLLHLPAPTRRMMLLAGALYVGGALGFEMLEGPIAAQFGVDNTQTRTLIVFEEMLEMSGVILLISTLLNYMCAYLPGFRLGLGVRA